jgi:hypothetical protein
MVIDDLFIEAKLTEKDFTRKDASVVEAYEGLKEHFHQDCLARKAIAPMITTRLSETFWPRFSTGNATPFSATNAGRTSRVDTSKRSAVCAMSAFG